MKIFSAIFILLAIITIGTQPIQAQVQMDIYRTAIEDINCTTIKLLLVGYDRPIAARNIKNCDYRSIEKEIKKIQENQVRGYKSLFVKLTTEINSYKDKIENPSEYAHFASALEEVSTYAVQQFRATCKKHQRPNNRVCVRLDQKVLQLEGDINNIANTALTKISQHTFGVGKPKPIKVETPKNETTDSEPSTSITSEDSSNEAEVAEALSKDKSSGTSIFVVFILVLLTGGVVWLFKENYLMKEEIADLKLLLKALSQRN